MSSVRFKNFQLGLMFATALCVSTLPAAAQAYTPEQEQACTPDAFRLCSAEVPDVDRITVCMIRNKSQLSPSCRAFFRSDPEPSVAAGRPTNIKPAKAGKPASAKPRKPRKTPAAS